MSPQTEFDRLALFVAAEMARIGATEDERNALDYESDTLPHHQILAARAAITAERLSR